MTKWFKSLLGIIIVLWHSKALTDKKCVYIVPIGGDKGYFLDPYYSRDEVARPFYELKKTLEDRGYNVEFTMDAAHLTDFEGLISFNDVNQDLLRNIALYNKNKCLLFILEPPVVMPSLYNTSLAQFFGKIFVMFDDYRVYHKYYYPSPRMHMVD